MGKLPGILLAIAALWLAWNAIHQGPETSQAGLVDLLRQPQYGEADRQTRSGGLADRALEQGSD